MITKPKEIRCSRCKEQLGGHMENGVLFIQIGSHRCGERRQCDDFGAYYDHSEKCQECPLQEPCQKASSYNRIHCLENQIHYYEE